MSGLKLSVKLKEKIYKKYHCERVCHVVRHIWSSTWLNDICNGHIKNERRLFVVWNILLQKTPVSFSIVLLMWIMKNKPNIALVIWRYFVSLLLVYCEECELLWKMKKQVNYLVGFEVVAQMQELYELINVTLKQH